MLTQIYSENVKERSHLGYMVADGNRLRTGCDIYSSHDVALTFLFYMF
jgi:hypothetical protein